MSLKLKKVVSNEKSSKKPAKKLSDIVDLTKLFTIIYSGVENEKYFKILYDRGIRDFLMSYHYLTTKSKGIESVRELGVRLFIDSGAHTYQNDEKYLDYTVEYWEEHLKKYLAWAKKNKDLIFAIANFDFENIVGAETVNRWNKEYFNLL